MNEVYCNCGELVEIEGEYPKFFAWCDTCHKYVDSFDSFEYAKEYRGNQIDCLFDNYKDGD